MGARRAKPVNVEIQYLKGSQQIEAPFLVPCKVDREAHGKSSSVKNFKERDYLFVERLAEDS